MHMGISTAGFVNWGGGVGFIENMLFGLMAVSDQVERITVFVPRPQQRQLRRWLGGIKRALLQPYNARHHLWGNAQAQAPWETARNLFEKIGPNVCLYDGTTADLQRQCRQLQVDVVLPSMTSLPGFGLPWAGYLFDCQHRYYPQFFKPDEIVSRDREFTSMLDSAQLVLVNAQAVVADLATFYPGHAARVVALPFAPLMRADSFASIMAQTPLAQQRYGTGSHYLMVCNQFWVHKDHRTAFEAFALARRHGALHNYRLVCSGLTQDYRFPGYFAELQTLLKKLQIQDHVVFTGYIDKLDQLALLSGAQALLQPTLFEGGPGGGAAYDAVALGVPSLLSDIAVNREITSPGVSFFKTGDAPALARALQALACQPVLRPDVQTLQQRSQQHASALGRSLVQAVAHLK